MPAVRIRPSEAGTKAAPNCSLTYERAHELFCYGDDGVLRWRAGRSGGVKSGDRAGCLSKAGQRCCLHVRVDQKKHYAHRIVWLMVHGAWPAGVIDHINGDAMDNRIANLRDVPHHVNAQNQRIPRARNKAGAIGVYPTKCKKNPYVAKIKALGKTYYIGCFPTAAEAGSAYLGAKRRLHEGCTI